MKFEATLLASGKTATGIKVPEEVVLGLGSSRKPAVTVSIHTFTYRSTIASMGGDYMLTVSAEVRRGAGIEAGDTFEVSVELDTMPRQVEIPDDFAMALAANSLASEVFEKLSYSNKRRIVIPIGDAKTAETRARRIEKSVESLVTGKI